MLTQLLTLRHRSFRIGCMNQEEILRLFSGVFGCSVLLLVVALAILVWWKIFDKAGYGGAYGLLMIIPIVNFVMLLILAFGRWPVLREVEELRRQVQPAPQVHPPQNI